MRGIGLFFIFVIALLSACKKSNHQKSADGSYSGVAIVLAPQAPPNDSTATRMQLKLSDGRFSGTADSSSSPFSVAVGSGAYAIQSGLIIFTQDSLNLDPSPAKSLIGGTYNLVKTGDSLVFQRIPDTELVGGTIVIFRLKKD